MSKRMAKLKKVSNVFSTIGNAGFTIGYDVFLMFRVPKSKISWLYQKVQPGDKQ